MSYQRREYKFPSWTQSIVVMLLLTIIVAQSTINPNSTFIININSTITYPTWLNSSQTEYNKFLYDKYNYCMTSKGNKVWVGSMNLAWNEMKKMFLKGENASFQNPTNLQFHMTDNLNSEIFTRSQLSDDAYYVSSGFGQQAVNQINFDLKQRYPLRTLPDLNYTLSDKDFIAYSYLFKKFQFLYPFADLNTFKFKNVTVPAFQSIAGSKHRSQLYYKYYNNSKDFMMGVKINNDVDEILMWKTNITEFNTMKIDKAMKAFDLFYNLPSIKFSRIDKFQMPVVDLDYTRSYKELLGMYFANTVYEDYQINYMDERLKLRVTKTGVTVQAQAAVVILLTSGFGAKYFYLDDNFWLILKEKGKQPYLIVYVSAVSEIWTE